VRCGWQVFWFSDFAVPYSTSFADTIGLKCVYPCQDEVVSCRRIAVIESEYGDGAFRDSFCGVSGRLKCVGKGENGTESWNATLSDSIIEPTGCL